MKVLDLFCGTKSVAEAFRARGHEVITLDNDPRFNPEMCVDILAAKASDFPKGIDVIWASPPCESFSIAAVSKNWRDGKPISARAKTGMALLLKTQELIKAIGPKLWFIENPRGMMRKKMSEVGRRTVTYCQYGDTSMKPTDIWSNSTLWVPRPMYHPRDTCHASAPRGSKTPGSTQGKKGALERARIPRALCDEIAMICEKEV